ncbi:hypothetical protein [Bacillus sp. T33-2]|uniref:hypothetical protein n=1 Tax=Bacillus sp. T33-2 TaxID=2054168 RepID=UPI000C76CD65|nr:hypothetical protein [Bacillus sp. T33-2]PLR93715.1 hypothetical protein CVD19_18460 [Bacillus sp. T33-2]
MNLRLEKKEIIILAVSVLLALLVYAAAQFFYIKPAKQSIEQKESQLKMESKLLASVGKQLSPKKETELSSTAELQKILPVDPMVEQLVLDLEKAEVVSGSFISSMEFGEGELVEESTQPDSDSQETESAGTQTANPSGENTQPEQNNGSSEIAEQNDNGLKMPEGVKKTSVLLTVRSENYADVEQFIEMLENLKRIVTVESIEFNGPDEVTALAEDEQPVTFKLTVSAYYMPELDGLESSKPTLEGPEPANKLNPFGSFIDPVEELAEQENPQ